MGNILKKLFGTLLQKPWETERAAIDNVHEGKTFNISAQKSAVIIIWCTILSISFRSNIFLGSIIKKWKLCFYKFLFCKFLCFYSSSWIASFRRTIFLGKSFI